MQDQGNFFTRIVNRMFGSAPDHLYGQGNFIVEKDVQGEWRWFAWTTNKWEDREGEILTDAAHIEFLNFLNENPDQVPELWSWHTKGTARTHKPDWWDYSNGFFMYSGVLTDAEAAPYINKEITDEPLGMSHGFYVLARVGKYITKYRTFEVSELPLGVAANPYTEFNLLGEINKMFTAKQRTFLVERYGEDRVAQLEGSTEDREKALTEMGVQWKELALAAEEAVLAEQREAVLTQAKSMVEGVVAELQKAMNLEGLTEALKTLNERIEANAKALAALSALEADVKALKETEDARIAAALTPQTWDWGTSVTQADKADTTDEEIIEQAAATKEYDWLQGLAGS